MSDTQSAATVHAMFGAYTPDADALDAAYDRGVADERARVIRMQQARWALAQIVVHRLVLGLLVVFALALLIRSL